MDSNVLKSLVDYLLEHTFKSKKELAAAVSVPYRTLLKAYAGQGGKDITISVTEHLLRYCIKNKIPLDQAIR